MDRAAVAAAETESPSARREWIEIVLSSRASLSLSRLPPRGGSGLKYAVRCSARDGGRVSLREEGVD